MSYTGNAIAKAMDGNQLTPAERAFTAGIRCEALDGRPDDSDWDAPGAPVAVDPETIPGHDYATEREYQEHVTLSTSPFHRITED